VNTDTNMRKNKRTKQFFPWFFNFDDFYRSLEARFL
jgi:hypothetical protein